MLSIDGTASGSVIMNGVVQGTGASYTLTGPYIMDKTITFHKVVPPAYRR